MEDKNIETIFRNESRTKKNCYVRIHETIVKNSDYVFHIDLGSCASVILCGIDKEQNVWFGINHLFKSRVQNDDMALYHVAELYNNLTENNASQIHCLGLFGAGYKKNSLAQNVAKKNIITILEALHFYNLSIEIFQTGYSQGISILKSDNRHSFLIKHYNINDKEVKIIEIPLSKIFH